MSTLRDRLSPDEWKAYRSAVNRKYAQSEKGKATQRRTNASPLAKERYARYRQTDGYRQAQERRRQKELADPNGWLPQRRHRERVRKDKPFYTRAWQAVMWGLEFGLIAKPDACEKCGRASRLHAHHGRGYNKAHWLDVEWLCAPCHKVAHGPGDPSASGHTSPSSM